MQQIGNSPDLARELLDQSGILSISGGSFGAEARIFASHLGDVDRHGGNKLAHAVVQFACDAAAFLILHLEEAAGKLTHDLGLVTELCVFFLKLGSALHNAPLKFVVGAAKLFAGFPEFLRADGEFGQSAAVGLGKNNDGEGNHEVDDSSRALLWTDNLQRMDWRNEPILLAEKSEKHSQKRR